MVEASKVVVSRYSEVISSLHKLGYQIILNGPFGSGFGVPRVGSEQIRNLIAVKLDNMLREKSELLGWLYSSLIDIVVDHEYFTNNAYFGEVDDNHLNKSSELCFYLLASILRAAKRKRNSTSNQCSIKPNNIHWALFASKGGLSRKTYGAKIINSGFALTSSIPESFLANSLLISLDDHINLNQVYFELDSSLLAGISECNIEFFDSQLESIGKANQLLCSNLPVIFDIQPLWVWYIEIYFDRTFLPSIFSRFSFKSAVSMNY